MKSALRLVVLFLAPYITISASAADTPPFGRIDYSLAYVPFLHSVLMYGGWAPPLWRPMNEVLTWDGKSWARSTPTGVPAFAHHTMAFDAGRNILVVCGRPKPHEGGEYQTWEFDAKAWTRRDNIPVGATALGDPKLTYDTQRKRLVLYASSYNGDTEVWEADSGNWQKMKFDHRPLRCDDNGCQFQYDESLKKAVLVGEERNVADPLAWDGHEWGMRNGSGTQTWLWDGRDWTQVRGTQPPRAMWGGMAYDAARKRLTLLTTRMETWTLKSDGWEKLSPPTSPTPSPNGFFELAYDAERQITIFFGGESRQTEPEKEWKYPETTWVWDGKTWSAR